ncbi:acyl-CoA dehydrogenase family protein [Longimicrobium terrae]|uniref:Alkylation response protein AidB-like acyl-CoA dehydrogenase n=1 Tax=Longimicrobium terrae TaxID=1639882 RepID=A0A841GY65_9BACT|nr:acyl-CoA dehydrogenase family protein [Longimicrobium terrae]MBB4636304.1 alkylation response protein AidB-like acyl-CoA dehydrogenase [Longimicrobium terrae]MBB6070700.1 alkylation response protein AidB-like acyl-CoA dehydrogenase [Longimicrobium terrae]NNC29681.1 acyl-CoA dehydrogenase [Longimicrobium terrae]
MPFTQTPPALANQYDDDRALLSLLARLLPPGVLAAVEPSLREMGRVSAELYPAQLADRASEPTLTQWDAWGNRVDRIELTPLWRQAERITAEHGVVAVAYERAHGALSRIHQFALAYLFTPSTDIYSCPLAMTDGAARALLASGNEELIARAVPHLTSRDPAAVWTSGQWMTETTGGSDVGRSETVARRDADGGWRLHGRKWFTSAATSQMALTLARPEGNPPGGAGLALFYLEPRDANGRLRNIRIDRLKEKLGTKKLPTAELTLDGVPAIPVGALSGGVRSIAPMLNVTRTWNAVSACALMRRGIALARDYAARREAFGTRLIHQPLHADTLAGLQAEFEGALHLTFRVAELLGRDEAGVMEEGDRPLLRVLTPLAKLTTARQSVSVTSEVVEAFGGAGYVEDTGIPMLLRDAQVLTIWEGTTNVLALDTLRALSSPGAPERLAAEAASLAAAVRDPSLRAVAESASSAIHGAMAWLGANVADRVMVEAGARRFALTLGRGMEAALLAAHAQWALDRGDARPAAAARRLAANGIDQLRSADVDDARLLAESPPRGMAERD